MGSLQLWRSTLCLHRVEGVVSKAAIKAILSMATSVLGPGTIERPLAPHQRICFGYCWPSTLTTSINQSLRRVAQSLVPPSSYRV